MEIRGGEKGNENYIVSDIQIYYSVWVDDIIKNTC
jgi:hypothetical protein